MPTGWLVRLIPHVLSRKAPLSCSRRGRKVHDALQGMVWLLLGLLERHGGCRAKADVLHRFPRETVSLPFSVETAAIGTGSACPCGQERTWVER